MIGGKKYYPQNGGTAYRSIGSTTDRVPRKPTKGNLFILDFIIIGQMSRTQVQAASEAIRTEGWRTARADWTAAESAGRVSPV